MALFNESIIKFEAAFDTPIKDAFEGIELDQWDDLLEVVVADVRRYAQENKVDVCRKTWDAYRKQANWNYLAESALRKKKGFFSKLFS